MAATSSNPQTPGDYIEPPGDSDQYPGDSSGHVNPALQSFVGSQDTDMGKAWSSVAAQRAQTYITARSNAIDAQQDSDSFVTNLDQAKQGLVGLVQKDPGSTDLALDLAQHTVNGIVDQHGHMDGDTRQGAANDLINHFQTEIAHAAVQSLAETDKGAALKALDRYGTYLPDDQQAALRQYADTMQTTREMDGAAQQLQQQRDTAEIGYHSATDHLNSMIDPDTGQYRVPGNFLSKLYSDPSLAPQTQLALRTGYSVLNQLGDPDQSNPHVVADMIDRMASGQPPKQGEIFSHLGSGITVNDASFLNHLIGPSTPQRRADIRQLSDVVRQARNTLASPGNGRAGTNAFGRFMNWLTPALQRGGNLGELTANNQLQNFAPTKDDYRTPARPMTMEQGQ